MKPQGILTEQDYQNLASELIDYHDPDNFLDNCEQQYIATNRGFYQHLLKAVKGFIFPESGLRQTDIVLIPTPDNAKTEKAVEVVKRRTELARQKGLIPFDINDLQFILKENHYSTEVLPGKTPHIACCPDTLSCLQGLIPYNPDERDFELFANVFSAPHIFRRGGTVPQMLNSDTDERLDDFFQNVTNKAREISRPDLKEYFFKCIEVDMHLEIHRGMSGKWKFPMMKFLERLEAVKQNALLEGNEPEITETESKEANPDFTTARQVLAVHYLLEYGQIRGIDQTEKAKFIQFLTGKNFKNIYDLVRSPLATKQGKFRRADLQFIRPYFENLGLTEIVKMINNQLDKPDF